jgi:hypothetical protein
MDEDLSMGAPAFHPMDEDLSMGTPAFHPMDEDLSMGTPACGSRRLRMLLPRYSISQSAVARPK